jgi:DNA-directed RNA polymerase subunit RPC12/RpoP
MIQFKCPECGQSIEAAEAKSQKRIQCPYCLEIVLVPRSALARNEADGDGLLPWLGAGLAPMSVVACPDDESEAVDY